MLFRVALILLVMLSFFQIKAQSCIDNEDCLAPQIVALYTGVRNCIADCNTGASA
jgi:hypothetical protein